VVPVTQGRLTSTAVTEGDTSRSAEGAGGQATIPPAPATDGRWGWTAGRITALVTGALMVLISVGLLGAGGTALWADLSHRDTAGYVTTEAHSFSTTGSAFATEPVELGDPGVGWLYSTVVLGEVRIRVTPASPGSSVFVGIGPSAAVDRYLAGVSQTVISDFWTNRLAPTGGTTPGSAPGTHDFWVASATGTGPQTLTWDPANGSWTVVVMNADGQAGVDVTADLGATMPTLIAIAVGSLAVGGLFLIGGVLLIAGSIRRSRARGPGPP
jgi:hypothetical protein